MSETETTTNDGEPIITSLNDLHTGEYQFFDDLSDEEYETSKADMEADGLESFPEIVTDENGTVIDGHQRLRMFAEVEGENADLPPETVDVRTGLTETEKEALAFKLNRKGRQFQSGSAKSAVKTWILRLQDRD